jgi:4-amino-4-deoxy-L-arabinose transferase-like glycosyltransferase
LSKLIRYFDKPIILIPVILAVFLFLIRINWVGYIASDDAVYLKGAYGLLNEFPFLGEHGTFRFIITAPIAASISLFGENEIAIALPTILYALALITMLIGFIRRVSDLRAVFIIAPLLVTAPILVIHSTIASIDIIEALFVFASLFLFVQASRGEGKATKALMLSGMMAGLAFLTRETAVFLLVFYGALFLMGIGIKRLHYFIMALGFFVVWGLETLYFWIFSSDPLYRFTRSFGHDSTIDRSIDLAGNFIIHPILDPVIVLFVNQEFGVLFWALMACVIWWYLKGKVHQADTIETAQENNHILPCKLIAGLGFVWFLCAGGVGNLLPLNPRYFLVTNIAAIIVTTLFLSDMTTKGKMTARIAYFVWAMIISVNCIGLWTENKNFLFAEKGLATLSTSYPQIMTDAETLHRAKYLLKWQGTSGRVASGDIVPKCGYYFHNRKYDQNIPSHWKLAVDLRPVSSLLKARVLGMGLGDTLPEALKLRLNGGHKGAVLYMNNPEGDC